MSCGRSAGPRDGGSTRSGAPGRSRRRSKTSHPGTRAHRAALAADSGYHALLAAYRLRDEAVRTRLERTAERQRVARSWQTIVGFPLFAYGAAANFLPYYLPGWLAGRMARRPTDYATTRLLASVVAFPLFWSLETALVGWAAGSGGRSPSSSHFRSGA